MSDDPNASGNFSEEHFRDWYEQLKTVVTAEVESGTADRVELGDACVQLGIHAPIVGEEPRPWFALAMKIYDQTTDTLDPRRLWPLCGIAMAYIHTDAAEDDGEAEGAMEAEDTMDNVEKWWNLAKPILESDAGRQMLEDNPPLAADLASVEGFVKRESDPDEAVVCFDRASVISEQYLAPDDPEWIQLLTNQAQAHQGVQDHATARQLLDRVIGLAKTYHEENPALITFCYELASLELRYENAEQAKELLDMVLAWRLENLDATDPDLGLTYHQLTYTEEALGNQTKAVEYARLSIQILLPLEDDWYGKLAMTDLCWLGENDPDFETFAKDMGSELAKAFQGGELDMDELDIDMDEAFENDGAEDNAFIDDAESERDDL